MQTKKGIPASHGVAMGKAIVLDSQDRPVPRRTVPLAQIKEEQERLDKALAASRKDIEELRDRARSAVGSLAKIFDFHLAVLHDESLISQVRELIKAAQVTAEYATYVVMRNQAQSFRNMDNRYFQERDRDIWDLERRMLGHLIGHQHEALGQLTHDAILIAHDLTPSETAGLDKQKIRAIATDLGGRTSHTAILAHALGIPAVVGLENLTKTVNTGDIVIVDGAHGVVVVDPDAGQQFYYRQEIERITAFDEALRGLAKKPAVTSDGTEITLLANIEFPTEIQAAVEKGAVGIGLYRTEFLFLASPTEPTEQEQFEAYKSAIKALGGRSLTIRTLDLGADKMLHGSAASEHEAERNPFLGCRSIRYCLQNLGMFKSQLRAILRASAEGPVRIMFPLISSVMEIRQAKMILKDVMEDLEEENVPIGRKIPVGIMIEVPSAALQAHMLTREVDFFSIGTNDLIQYTVAVDRGNERVANLYSAAHPAVIQLIKEVIRAGARAKVEVGLCGEMAGEPEFVMLLLGLGLRSLSMTPPAIPEVKKIIRSVSINHCQRVARKAAAFDTDREVLNYLRDEVRKIVPEAVDGWSIES
jgi:phosphoenolpyruvate-protein phosphotransferase (PTS system enzyme I)